MNQEIIEAPPTVPLSALQIRSQVNLIQSVMKEVMQEGQHYGKIPGCGDKPTLLKPGAEKLSMTFRLRPIIDNDRDVRIDTMDNGHREVTVYCHVMTMQGIELATGVGSCSTMESKYRYRGGEKTPTGQKVPAEYWNLKNEGKMREAKEKIGGDGFGVAKINGIWEIVEHGEKMENPDIADTYNTVLKMAKKRAYVDGILSATAASDIFTQDLEDLPVAQMQTTSVQEKPTNGKPAVKPPEEKRQIKAVDLVTLLQAKKGDKMNVMAYYQSADHKQLSDKKDKEKKWDITEYKVTDLPTQSTAETIIKVFGTPVLMAAGDVIVFENVEVTEYNGKPQYVAKGVVVDV